MPVRITGLLQKFETAQFLAHGYVRVDDTLLHVAVRERGVLGEDGKTILLCANGDRYDPIKPDTPIVLDVEYSPEGKHPFVVAWAPKSRTKSQR